MRLLLYFLPKSLCVDITEETNRYKKRTAHTRAKRIRTKLRKRHAATPGTVKEIGRRLRAEPAYQPHDILHVIGLRHLPSAVSICPSRTPRLSCWLTKRWMRRSGTPSLTRTPANFITTRHFLTFATLVDYKPDLIANIAAASSPTNIISIRYL
ncbi:hypothetical protein PC110_g19168 [Phytophthora cactorum]|uniref:Uncharacterized protein n=1 Tax=Phytophthora cactorum TaxID=29920 RepID=A0A329RIH2_9STRA|nr:hypothetical protein PC110_g19168 [Phytophthora cactorum]